MTEFVRVKDPETKHEATVSRKYAEAYGLEILADKDAVDSVGRPLVGKAHVDLPKAKAPDTKTQSGGDSK
jgi:hypothetical protein